MAQRQVVHAGSAFGRNLVGQNLRKTTIDQIGRHLPQRMAQPPALGAERSGCNLWTGDVKGASEPYYLEYPVLSTAKSNIE